MAKNWHKKHIPTKWGVAIIGFLLVSLALLIPYLNNQQDIRSDALGRFELYFHPNPLVTQLNFTRDLNLYVKKTDLERARSKWAGLYRIKMEIFYYNYELDIIDFIPSRELTSSEKDKVYITKKKKIGTNISRYNLDIKIPKEKEFNGLTKIGDLRIKIKNKPPGRTSFEQDFRYSINGSKGEVDYIKINVKPDRGLQVGN